MNTKIELFCLFAPIVCLIVTLNSTPNMAPNTEVRVDDYSGDYDCSELSEFTGKNECAVLGLDNITGEELKNEK